jgi:riboflavin biosynthesis pyrimidine reductase
MRLVLPPGGNELTELSDDELAELYAFPDRETPRVRMNFVTSVDGASTVDGLTRGLSGPPDLRVFKILRNLSDAILVGAGTFRAESYGRLPFTAERRAWRVAAGLTEVPALVVVSRSAVLPDGADIVVGGDLREALSELASRGLRQILCEGGPHLFGALQAADLVDEICLTVSPLMAGAGALRMTAGMPSGVRNLRLDHVLEESGMLLLRYSRTT